MSSTSSGNKNQNNELKDAKTLNAFSNLNLHIALCNSNAVKTINRSLCFIYLSKINNNNKNNPYNSELGYYINDK